MYGSQFPSLTGVIRFLIWCIDLTDVTEMFPSLTGVIRFLIEERKNNRKQKNNVSVPYRGYSFFN